MQSRHGGRDENPPNWRQKSPLFSWGGDATFQKQASGVDPTSAPPDQRSQRSNVSRLSRHDDRRFFHSLGGYVRTPWITRTSTQTRRRSWHHSPEYLDYGFPISNLSGARSDWDERTKARDRLPNPISSPGQSPCSSCRFGYQRKMPCGPSGDAGRNPNRELDVCDFKP